MAGSKSDFLETTIQKLILSATAYTAPTTVALALSTAAYTDAATGASMNEVTGGSYARVAQTNNTTNFPVVGANTATTNATAFTFVTATGSYSAAILSAYLVDSATIGAGNVLIGSDITSKTVGTGDTVSVAIGALTYQED